MRGRPRTVDKGKSMRANKRFGAAVVSLLILGASGAAPALAAEWTHSDNGGKVTVSGKKISLKDTGDDGRFVTTEYRYNGGQSSGGLANKAGYGTTTSVTQTSDITNDKICRSQTFPLPMDCGSWKF